MGKAVRGARAAARSSFMPPRLAASLRRRGLQLVGFALALAGFALALSLVSFDPGDPSFNRVADGPVHNWLGFGGAYAADLLLQTLGIAGSLIALVPAVWGWRLMTARNVSPMWVRLTLWPLGVLATAIALAAINAPDSWPLKAGLGGFAGSLMLDGAVRLQRALGFGGSATLAAYIALAVALLTLVPALALSRREWLTGSIATARWSGRTARASWRITARLLERVPLRPAVRPLRPVRPEPIIVDEDEDEEEDEEEEIAAAPRGNETVLPRRPIQVAPRAPEPEPRRRRTRQPALNLGDGERYRLPSLDLLHEPPAARGVGTFDEAALAHNAQLLESVLDDFGVKGQVVEVRPGPVVTLYEFEPAPGIKSVRIVNLSDDIARSMSAVSVRVAVIPGRTVIGIELPNGARETVYLREVVATPTFERSSAALALMLGKDIGGSPVVVDLARMPHLLIAGTTGSGKSVAINTMILSLLYRLPPDQCKFIMIDPKMLELSVYDGIPQLLAPVVTDPRKAVVALKWAVREMEERYQAMSKLGVRNIQGFNARLEDARRKGERLRRRVQTGFDPDTGAPLYEEQDLSLEPLPYIVVVVDEMADLMLVAGKDIEIAVQRLAQMARAAGIHLIMATQRPSVDVITGTIKANFPTRISFQVTSKIDSRTILGEQGAEQLLGQGDMLYMAGGGRITRIHGPFVSDDEVEEVVRFLKSQGEPDYIEEVTEADDLPILPGLDGGGDDDLYQQAVGVVIREGKASTSYIQRQLQIGYNRAARLIERMEAEGIVSPANHAGKREILAQGG
jgi:S-DNA-T family DNA segregation ATPase FtsK/SpoIIIE